MHPMHISKEMYLESILRLSRVQELVRSIDISRDLDVSTPSVCTALQRLAAEGCTQMNEGGHVSLTKLGESVALKVFMKHKTLEYFFIKIGVDPVAADRDACRIEHAMSDDVFEVFKAYVLDCFPVEGD